VGERDLAQELVAEAYARAWASWHTVSKHPAPLAWVVRTALNVNISRWRRRRREVFLPDLSVVADARIAHPPADAVVDSAIMTVLLRLPIRQRQVIALRLLLDLDTATTAELLGIEPGTVRVHFGRAVATLRDALMPDRQEETRS